MIIFAGPTIASDAIRAILPSADIRPPARTGDIYLAAQDAPPAIGLIDGFFEGVPAVWHKEILWAMTQDIPVFGASSMGALRAAELHAFGMIGIGWIFEAYRDGRLEDDDEVALRHGPQEMGYIPLSEPMVNIRATLDRAVTEGVLDPPTASRLTALAKTMHFPERSWNTLLPHAPDLLQDWLSENQIDQKRRDAEDMLTRMVAPADAQTADFTFQHTVMWEGLRRQCDRVGPGLTTALLFDDVRQDTDSYQMLRRRAADHLPDTDWDIPAPLIDAALTQVRSDNRLYTGAVFNAWLADNDLTVETLRDAITQDIRLSAMAEDDPNSFNQALLTALKADGVFASLMATAKSQADALVTAGFDAPTPADTGLSPVALLVWYFETLRREPVPPDMDLFLQIHDYPDRGAFEQMMARQYLLWQDRID